MKELKKDEIERQLKDHISNEVDRIFDGQDGWLNKLDSGINRLKLSVERLDKLTSSSFKFIHQKLDRIESQMNTLNELLNSETE